jgi:hypothetical protein
VRIIHKKGFPVLLVILIVLIGLNGLFIGGNKVHADPVTFAGGTGQESNLIRLQPPINLMRLGII